MKYSEEQIKDIQDREAKCLEFLKEQQMNITADMSMTNLGNDTFGIKPVLYLSDFKYKEEPKDGIEEAQTKEKPKKK